MACRPEGRALLSPLTQPDIPMRLLLPCLLLLAACTEFPALEGTVPPAQANAPFPALVPLAPLVAQAETPQTDAAGAEAALAPRLSALRARAARLRGPVIPPAQRARMLRGLR